MALLSLASCGFVCSFPCFTSAFDVEQKKESISELKKQSEALRSDLIETQKNINEESQKKEELDNQIKEVQSKIDASNNYINSLGNQILGIQDNIKEIEKEIEVKIELLKEALVCMYKAGDASTLDIVLGAKDFSDFLEKTDIVKSVGDTIGEIINTLKEKTSELESEKAKIDGIKKQQEEESIKLEQSRNEFQNLLDQSEELLAKYGSSAEQAKKQIGENEAQIRAADEEIKRYYQEQKRKEQEALRRKRNAANGQISKPVYDSSKVVNQGGFIWPVPGYSYISSDFYDTVGRRSVHGAIDIAGAGIYGAKVVASGSGTVIKVKYSNSGYGNNIVIDHGNGISTQYSHLSSIAVSEGQKVSRGQVIGQVGNTGFSTGPHLDFTVRLNGVKQNPLNYVSRPSNNKPSNNPMFAG